MKKVMFELKEKINVNDLNDNSLVGIIWSSHKKTIITKVCNKFISISKNDYDLKSSWFKDSIKEYVIQANLNNTDIEVFVFSTRSEMENWLIS